MREIKIRKKQLTARGYKRWVQETIDTLNRIDKDTDKMIKGGIRR